jgi:RHS repeat-associated protein
MQLGSSTNIPDGLLAAMLLNEKPHHGVTSKNPAPNPGSDERNSTTALGFEAGLLLNRVGSCFTGKERDTESGNDYFGARYYASSMGRFMSPDPIGIMAQKLSDRQQWNMYQYSKNNPLRFTDPSGLYVTTCVSGDKACAANASAFEKARQSDLKSKDASVRAAAGAYGDPGKANGITVTWGDPERRGWKYRCYWFTGQTAQAPAVPILLEAALPMYPPIWRAAHLSGKVIVRVTVKDGHVVETAVQSGEPHLQVPTTSNPKTWRFDDQVSDTFTVIYTYEIAGEPTDDPTNPKVVFPTD